MTQIDLAFIRAYAQLEDAPTAGVEVGDRSLPPNRRSPLTSYAATQLGRTVAVTPGHQFVPHPHVLRQRNAEPTQADDSAVDATDSEASFENRVAENPAGETAAIAVEPVRLDHPRPENPGSDSRHSQESGPELEFPPVAIPSGRNDPPLANATAAAKDKVTDTTSRKPLSSYMEPRPQATAAFRPGYEVDAFRWPPLVEQLATHASEPLDKVRLQVEQACLSGHNLIAFCSRDTPAGCTSLVLATARMLAANGLAVVVVDADLNQAGMTRSLGLAPACSWQQVLAGTAAISDAAVRSVRDHITAIVGQAPTRTTASNEGLLAVPGLGSMHAVTTMALLRQAYDAVLLDVGHMPADDPSAEEDLRRLTIDGVVTVATAGETSSDLEHILGGVPRIARIENLWTISNAATDRS